MRLCTTLISILFLANTALSYSQAVPSHEEYTKIKLDFEIAFKSLGVCLQKIWLKDGKQAIINYKNEKNPIFLGLAKDAAYFLFANQSVCAMEKEKSAYEMWRFRKISGQEVGAYQVSVRDLYTEQLTIWANAWAEYESFGY